MELFLVNKQELKEMLGEVIPQSNKPDPIKEEPKYLSPARAIEHMGNRGIQMSKSTLYKLTMKKKIPFVRFGEKKILFEIDELNAWIESRLERRSGVNPVTSSVAQDARSKKL
jgi:excisionase family DNA binding protein